MDRLVPGTYSTIQAAVNAAGPGDRILVSNGTYSESITINGQSGTSAAPITLMAVNRGMAVITHAGNPPVAPAAKLKIQRAYWIVDGFKFQSIKTNDRQTVVRFDGATNSAVRHCTFDDCGTTSTDKADRDNTYIVEMTGGSTWNDISHCEFSECPAICFQVKNNDSDVNNVSNVFRYNRFLKRIGAFSAPASGSDDSRAIRIGFGTDAAANNPTNTLIEHNLWDDVWTRNGNIYLKCGNNTVRHNTFVKTAGAIAIRRGPCNQVFGNYFIDGAGIRVRDAGHYIGNNYIEGVFDPGWVPPNGTPETSQGDEGIFIEAGQTQQAGQNSGHVAVQDCTVENNTVYYIGKHAFTFGGDWQIDPGPVDLRCKNVAPTRNTIRKNLFLSNGGAAVYRYLKSGSLCDPDPAKGALVLDVGNTWSQNVKWFVAPGTTGYSRSGIEEGNPVVQQNTYLNWVPTAQVNGVPASAYGARPPRARLTVVDVGPGSSAAVLMNKPPKVSNIPDQTINQNTSTAVLPFTVSDVETAATSLSVVAWPLNTLVVPTSGVQVTGSGNNRNIQITPAPGASGIALIRVQVSDGNVNSTETFTVTVNQVENTTGLVGWWKFNEASGTSATDSMGGDNTGTLSGFSADGAEYYAFDGVDNLVNVGSAANLDNLPSFTLSAWVWTNNTGENGFGRIFDKGSTGFRFLVRDSNQLSCTVNYGGGTELTRISAASAVPIGSWRHVAATWTGSDASSSLRIYTDGVEVGSYTTSSSGTGTRGNDSANSLILGNVSNGSRTFNGNIDDQRVYNRALTALEILTLKANGRR